MNSDDIYGKGDYASLQNETNELITSSETESSDHSTENSSDTSSDTSSISKSSNYNSYSYCESSSYMCDFEEFDGARESLNTDTPMKKMTLKRRKLPAIKTCSTFGSRKFPWKKSLPWKNSTSKGYPLHFTQTSIDNDSTHCILSAQLQNIKELRNELCHLQIKLDAVNLENKTLKGIQQRQTVALEKFEREESNLHLLVARHSNEVHALTQLLKKAQEQERCVTRKLKATESELLWANQNVQKFQKLADDKNLPERDALRLKLCYFLAKTEESDEKIKALEKQLALDATFYNQLLSSEGRKLIKARKAAEKLQTEVNSLHQKMKEKERELEIKNIYANRMPRNLHELIHSHCQEGLSKSTQTDIEMLLKLRPEVEQQEFNSYKKEETYKQFDTDADEDLKANNSHSASDESPLNKTQNVDHSERQNKNKKEQEEDLETLGKYPIVENDLLHYNTDNHSDIDQTTDNIFTDDPENLHQELSLSDSPLRRTTSSLSFLSIINEANHGLLSDENHTKNSQQNDAMEGTVVKHTDRKDTLMEELFGSKSIIENNISVQSEQDNGFLENQSSQAGGQATGEDLTKHTGDSRITPSELTHSTSPLENAVNLTL